MKFMAVNARDGENVEKSVLTLVADTMAHQKAHCNDPVDPWATPFSSDTQPPVSLSKLASFSVSWSIELLTV